MQKGAASDRWTHKRSRVGPGYGWWNELVSVMVDGKWYIFRNICFVMKNCDISVDVECINDCPVVLLDIIMKGLFW